VVGGGGNLISLHPLKEGKVSSERAGLPRRGSVRDQRLNRFSRGGGIQFISEGGIVSVEVDEREAAGRSGRLSCRRS